MKLPKNKKKSLMIFFFAFLASLREKMLREIKPLKNNRLNTSYPSNNIVLLKIGILTYF